MDKDLPRYELYAIRYATREGRRADYVSGGEPHDEPMRMDYFVWVARHGGDVVLIDMGFCEKVAASRRRTFLRCPIDALSQLGVDAGAIRDVVVTHLHYDHAGNFGKLPNARFHIHEAEVRFATGPHVRHRYFAQKFEVDDVVNVVRLNFEGRISWCSGVTEVAPGLRVHPAPGHTPGQQVVQVHTRRGWVVVASDATHFYENILERRPFPSVVAMPDVLDTFERIHAMAGGPEHIIPGHDPLVMTLYPPARAELQGIVARLDADPDLQLVERELVRSGKARARTVTY